MELLTRPIFGNTIQSWLIAVAVAAVAFVLLRVVAVSGLRRLVSAASRTENAWDDVLAAAIDATRSWVVTLVALWVGASTVALPDRAGVVLRQMTVIALLVQAGLWISAGLTKWLEERARERVDEEPAEVMTLSVIGILVKIAIWSMVLLVALDNLGIDVTALVAGLGVGGVAVALAAQNILGDLIASLSIVFDKPFVPGDFLVVGDFMGAVEAIGFKTTRVRSLSGEQVVFSNTDLLTSRIRNYGRMYERRVVFKLGVTYQTARARLKEIPGIVRDAVGARAEDEVRFDRSHMSAYGDFAIVFESVFYVLSPDYNTYMDIQQDIYLRIHQAFEDRGIEFAYPTQTLFVERAAS